MSAHYCLVTVWSQSGSSRESREGKAECHCPVGVVMIWKIISSFVGCADVLTRAAGAIGRVNPAGDSVSATVTLELTFHCWVFTA